MVIPVFLAGTLLLFLSGVPGLWLPRGAAAGERIALALVLAGAALGLGAAAAAVASPGPHLLQLPWEVPVGGFRIVLDGLAAVFLIPVYLVAALGAVYGLGYWPQLLHPGNGRRLRLFYGVMAGALTLVLAAGNGVLFLAAWEVMAIAGFFLVTTEEKREEARRAGFIYLAATHAGTLALFAFFILLGGEVGTFDLPAAGAVPVGGGATALFLTALFGFGLKAGLMPLHVWLPGAHAAAPSHVSALLSGVLIKSGIYGLVRTTSFFSGIPPWWGWTVLALGAVSAVLGVAFAIAQHDIKRLLAYHSVENIGIIALGLGAALLGRSYGLPAVTALGLAGALLHVINHGLFKSLLFLGAGAVVHATGTREIDRCGGLLRGMPVTAFCFLGGAVAISGLPPLNGFISEWLVYIGLFRTLEGEPLAVRLAALAAPVLALVGALALACFVKVFGAVFLGSARSEAAVGREASVSMLLPMGVLLAGCAAIGLFPPLVVPLLSRASADWSGGAAGSVLPDAFSPLAAVSGCALALLLLVGGAAVLLLRRRSVGARGPTWGCGYSFPAPRMQYTASSFAEMLTGLFRWGLRPETHGREVQGTFPPPASFSRHTPDTVLDRLILPGFHFLARLFSLARKWIQHGFGGIYLLYIAVTLVLLLAAAFFLGG